MTNERPASRPDRTAEIMAYFGHHPLIAEYVVASEEEQFRVPGWMPAMRMEAMRAETLRLGLREMTEQRAEEIVSLARHCVLDQVSTEVSTLD